MTIIIGSARIDELSKAYGGKQWYISDALAVKSRQEQKRRPHNDNNRQCKNRRAWKGYRR